VEHRQKAALRRGSQRGIGTDGAAAVELAITVSFLAVLALGIADYGILMNDSAALMGASRAGAEYAIGAPSDQTGIEQQVCAFFGLTLSGTSCSPVTPAASAPACYCIDGTSVSCNAAGVCASKTNPYISGNPADPRVLEYVTVTAQQNFSPLFNVQNFGVIAPTTFAFPGTLTGTTVARTQ
jgi:Flp pilus assembly protein TadG